MYWRSFLLLGVMGYSSVCFAAQNTVDQQQSQDLVISIYNNNLALVKDSRDVTLQTGNNNIAFEGVATQIKPESVIIFGDGIKVLEQNYDYDLLTPQNIINKSVGMNVKTAVENPTTGENIFDKAKIISATYGAPVLEFDYGIETHFPGRIVFEKLPENLHSKPTLAAKIASVNEGLRRLSLAYLTNGISWKSNYVAKVTSQNTLDLTGWVTINNQSGVDYGNAKVQLIAGDVNQVREGGIMPRANRVYAAKGMAAETAAVDMAVSMPQQISGYHLYNLPDRTEIKDNQTKQISLLEKNGVKFRKEGRLTSPLYLGGEYEAGFERQHPAMYYLLTNTENDNLGLPLPAGIMRFYENDHTSNLQFIGENSIGHTAKGEKMELNLGSLFNVYANGKIKNVRKVAENKLKQSANDCWNAKVIRQYDVVVNFYNGGNEASEVVFTQNINQDIKIVSESLPGKAKNINEYEWRINIPADGRTNLTFTAEKTTEEHQCR